MFNKDSKLFQQLNKQAQNIKISTSVSFEDCKFSTIVSELFNEKNLDLPNLKTISFKNTEIEEIEPKILDSKVTKLIMNNFEFEHHVTKFFINQKFK